MKSYRYTHCLLLIALLVLSGCFGRGGPQPTTSPTVTFPVATTATPAPPTATSPPPQPTSPPATAVPTSPPAPTKTPCGPPAGWVAYTVRVGDTLYSLAKRTNTTVPQIQRANCLNSTVILSGQPLYLPFSPPTPTIAATAVPPTKPPAPPPTGPGTRAGELAIQPFAGPVGTEHTAVLGNFIPEERVTVELVHLETEEAVYTTDVTVDAEGSGFVTFVTQPQYPTGPYTLHARGETGTWASTDMAIEAGTPEPPPAQPSLSVTPYAGPPGTRYMLQLTGFVPNTRVTLRLTHNQSGKTIMDLTTTVDASGSDTLEFVSLPDDPRGIYTVVARGPDGAVAQAELKVGE